MCPPDDPAESLKLDSLQRDVLLPQIEAFLAAARDPEAQAIYLRLKESIQNMEVPPEFQARLGAIVEVTLASGRARKQFGPGAELSLAALFQKTPHGKEIAESIRALNAALAKLTDQSIENASATLRGPGAYALTLKTSGCQIVIRFDASGVRVESMEFDLG
jgi:hypothetical protein